MTNEPTTTLADLIHTAILVGKTRRFAELMHDRNASVALRAFANDNKLMAERMLEDELHEFTRTNHTQPF